MFERFTEPARKAVFFGRYEASMAGSAEIAPEHLLLGIFREEPQLAQRLLRGAATLETLRHRIQKPGAQPGSTSGDMPLSGVGKRALAHAAQAASKLNDKAIRPVHLLIGIAREEACLAARILREHGVTVAQLREEAVRAAQGPAAAPPQQPPRGLEGSLRDLTESARVGKIGLLVGRERELDRILHILARKTKNNPVLIGEAGVGKTAIVEGLARRMAAAEVPPELAERRLLAIDATALTSPRQRARSLEQLEDALGAIDPANTLLFVRGLFNLAAAGPAWAVVEAMHALEPRLARWGMQCIATGSPAGLRETVAKAPMLARHFEVVPVAAASEADAVRIVSALKPQFEQFHEVAIGDEAVEAAVYASGLFLPGRHLPDRAIDLIDEAAAAVRLRRENEPPEVAEVRRRIRQHARAIFEAVAPGEFENARHHSDEERRAREELERLLPQPHADTVTPEDIHAAAAARAGMPLAAVKLAIEHRDREELQRISGVLASLVPPQARDWVPFLAAYLARCSPAEANALAQAIAAAKATPPPGETKQ